MLGSLHGHKWILIFEDLGRERGIRLVSFHAAFFKRTDTALILHHHSLYSIASLVKERNKKKIGLEKPVYLLPFNREVLCVNANLGLEWPKHWKIQPMDKKKLVDKARTR